MTLRVERAAKVIGMPVTQAQCEDVMRRLGLPFTPSPGACSSRRRAGASTCRIEEDLIEEVIRVLGYDALPDASPRGDADAARVERIAA